MKRSRFSFGPTKEIFVASPLSRIEKILEKLMHKCLRKFLNDSNLLFEPQFGFRQNFYIAHVLTNLAESIRQALDEEKIECRIFKELQKAFDTVDHEFLVLKVDHYGVHAVTNNWFKLYPTDCK